MVAELVHPARLWPGLLRGPWRLQRIRVAVANHSILALDAASARTPGSFGGGVPWLGAGTQATLNGVRGRVQITGLHEPHGFLHGAIQVVHQLDFLSSVDP